MIYQTLRRVRRCRMAAALAVLLALALPATAMSETAGEAPATLVTVVTAPEPQTQLMAMVLTLQAIQQGAEARVLLCGPGGDLGLADPPESAVAGQEPQGASPQGLLRRLIEAGVPVEVCALYLPNAGLAAEALLDGVTPAEPPAMAAHLIAPNVRLLTF